MTMEIPGYQIVRELGKGGMAAVYLAIQRSFGREVALKIMSPALSADPKFHERFIREAHIVSRLVHPNIVTVYDVGEYQDHHYLSMEYVRGHDLRHMRDKLSLQERVRVVKEVARALDYASKRGYVHRDIKPDNIMLHEDDGRAVLTDFGIARAVEGDGTTTQTGSVIGTPQYMSPEQARGGKVDHRSDLYSLGVVLFQLLAGHVPYHADTPVAVAVKHITELVPRLPDQYRAFQQVMDKVLAKDPDERFQSGAELIVALDRIVDAQASATALAGRAAVAAAPAPGPLAASMPAAPPPQTLVLEDYVRQVAEASPPEEESFVVPDEYRRVPTLVERPARRGSWLLLSLAALIVAAVAAYYYADLLPAPLQALVQGTPIGGGGTAATTSAPLSAVSPEAPLPGQAAPAPAVRAPAAPASAAPAPAVRAPAAPASVTPAATAQAPAAPAPIPAAPAPAAQAPAAQAPAAQAPAAQAPAAQAPVAPPSGTPAPTASAPVAQAPTAQAPVVQQAPVAQAPAAPATPAAQPPAPAKPSLRATLEDKAAALRARLDKDPTVIPQLAALYLTVLADTPDDAWARRSLDELQAYHIKRTGQALAAGNYGAAQRYLDAARASYPAEVRDPEFARLAARLARVERVRDLLAQADGYLKNDALSSPPGANALEAYRAVLTADPDNVAARAGIAAITRRYEALARQQVEKGDLDRALALVERGLGVSAGDAALGQLKQEVEAARARRQQIDTLLEQAHARQSADALITPSGASAYDSYHAVLALDGQNAEAQSGLQQIEAALAGRIEPLLKVGDLKAAETALAEARDRFPRSAALLTLQEQLDQAVDAAQPKVTQVAVSATRLDELAGAQDPTLHPDRTIFIGFRYANFSERTSVIQAVLYDGARSVQIAQVPVIVSGRAGVTFFQIDRPVEGFGEGGYNIDLMLDGRRLISTSFRVEGKGGG